ncbi:MAG TPA: hypothetical protein VFL64_17635 [Rhizobacter sp.]|nr:hypothetical protein [Rhizobacter sp.]
MKDLQEATERICELKGSLIALDVLVTAVLRALPHDERQRVLASFAQHAEVARTILLNEPISELTIGAFEHDVRRLCSLDDATVPSGE